MKKKKKTIYQVHTEQHWQRREWASVIREQFPNVESIAITILSTPEAAWMGGQSRREHNFTPDDKAFFRFPCRFNDCVGGFLEISEEVSKLVSSHKSDFSGKTFCDGWQDEDRIGKHRCLLRMEYTITVRYSNPD